MNQPVNPADDRVRHARRNNAHPPTPETKYRPRGVITAARATVLLHLKHQARHHQVTNASITASVPVASQSNCFAVMPIALARDIGVRRCEYIEAPSRDASRQETRFPLRRSALGMGPYPPTCSHPRTLSPVTNSRNRPNRRRNSRPEWHVRSTDAPNPHLP